MVCFWLKWPFFCLVILTVERERSGNAFKVWTTSKWDTHVCVNNGCFSLTNWNGMQLSFCSPYKIIEVTPSHSSGKKLRSNFKYDYNRSPEDVHGTWNFTKHFSLEETLEAEWCGQSSSFEVRSGFNLFPHVRSCVAYSLWSYFLIYKCNDKLWGSLWENLREVSGRKLMFTKS